MSSNSLYIKNIVSNNCGGIGSWRFNALSSPAPGAQTGGFKNKKATRRRKITQYRTKRRGRKSMRKRIY
jgi:hypothetical protein